MYLITRIHDQLSKNEVTILNYDFFIRLILHRIFLACVLDTWIIHHLNSDRHEKVYKATITTIVE